MAVIGVNTVFSLYYYARVIRAMYLVPSDKPAVAGHPLGNAVAVGCAAMLLLMLVAYNPVQKLTSRYAKMSVVRASEPSRQPAVEMPQRGPTR